MGRTYSLALSAVYGLAWPAAPEIRRVRVAEVSRRLGESAARAWGWDEATDDWRAVTRADDVDLVLVLTPTTATPRSASTRSPAASTCCARSRCPAPSKARAMYRAAVRSRRVHQVGFVYRKWPAVAFARQIIEGGGIGEIVHYRGHFFHDYGLDPALPITWRLNKAISGGGSGADIGSHVIDMARYLAGEIRGVRRSRTHFTRRPLLDRPGETAAVDVDEITDMLVEFEGALGTLRPAGSPAATRWTSALRCTAPGARSSSPPRSRPRCPSRPAIRPERLSVDPGRPRHPGAELFWPVPGMALGFGDGFIIAVRDLLRAIADGRSAEPDFLDGLRASEVVAAAQASAATRSWQAVERLDFQELELG